MAKQSEPYEGRPEVQGCVSVLLTRPEAASTGFAKALAAQFPGRTRTVIAPLMEPDYLAVQLTGGNAGVIFTSATAVEAAVRLGLRTGPAFCVGKETATRASAAGFDTVSADGDAEALVAYLGALRPKPPLLHLCGAERRGDVAGRLSALGLPTDEIVVYRQRPLPLSQGALALLQDEGPLILPLFSPRSARLFAEALPPGLRATLLLAALSPAVADACAGIACIHLAIAPQPDAAGMLQAVAKLLDQAAPP